MIDFCKDVDASCAEFVDEHKAQCLITDKHRSHIILGFLLRCYCCPVFMFERNIMKGMQRKSTNEGSHCILRRNEYEFDPVSPAAYVFKKLSRPQKGLCLTCAWRLCLYIYIYLASCIPIYGYLHLQLHYIEDVYKDTGKWIDHYKEKPILGIQESIENMHIPIGTLLMSMYMYTYV